MQALLRLSTPDPTHVAGGTVGHLRFPVPITIYASSVSATIVHAPHPPLRAAHRRGRTSTASMSGVLTPGAADLAASSAAV